MSKDEYRKFAETEEFKTASRKLRMWLLMVLSEFSLLLLVGLITFIERVDFRSFGFIRGLLQCFPGPTRMVAFMSQAGESQKIDAALFNIFFVYQFIYWFYHKFFFLL